MGCAYAVPPATPHLQVPSWHSVPETFFFFLGPFSHLSYPSPILSLGASHSFLGATHLLFYLLDFPFPSWGIPEGAVT